MLLEGKKKLSAILLLVPIHCKGNYNSIALTHQLMMTQVCMCKLSASQRISRPQGSDSC